VSLMRLIPWQYGTVVGMTSYRTVTVCRIGKRGKRKGARGNSGDWTRNAVLSLVALTRYRARLRPWPEGPAAPVGCNLPCLWSWPASEPGFPEQKMPSPPGPLETTKTLISLEPSSWRHTQAILGGGGVARAGSGGKGKLLRARPRSPLPL